MNFKVAAEDRDTVPVQDIEILGLFMIPGVEVVYMRILSPQATEVDSANNVFSIIVYSGVLGGQFFCNKRHGVIPLTQTKDAEYRY